ncbi:MAG: glycine zipper domain-containing protein [Gammaproteobacteria bacterium]|jgi:hypothetical protein|nr:glycine zipper domain-containing protein [Gammaproteobacteria bacterium]
MVTRRAHFPRSPKTAARLLAALPMVTVIVTGCVSTATTRPDDAGDSCATERAELRGAQDYYARAIVQGAAIGGLVGGLAGYLVGDSKRATAIGAATGALAGGIGGYLMAKQRVATDAASLNDSVLRDVVTESQEIDKATLAFAKLRDCRFTSAAMVREDYRAGRLTRGQAAARLDDLRRRFDADLQIAEEVGVKMGERAREFKHASDQLVAQDSGAGSAAGTSSRAPASGSRSASVASATQTNQLKQKAFADDVQVAKNKAQAAFSLEGQVGMTLPVCPAGGTA